MHIVVSVFPKTESYTSSEFKFGWELEAIADSRYKGSSATIKAALDAYFERPGTIDDDETIKGVRKGETSFEYKSSVESVTPGKLSALRKMLDALPELGIHTNQSCGLHVHYSFPHLTENDLRWVILGISLTPSLIRLVSEFEDYAFYDETYAKREFLYAIRRSFRQKTWSTLVLSLNHHKFRTLRLHPQGTLEWRGPRSFLDTPNPEVNTVFVRRIYEIGRAIDTLLRTKEYEGVAREELEMAKHHGKQSDSKPRPDDKRFNTEDMSASNIATVLREAPWIDLAHFEDATIEIDPDGEVVWTSGTWIGGVWKGGTWMTGVWEGGVWEDGVWDSGTWKKGTWKGGTWISGKWYSGKDASGNVHDVAPNKWK